MPSRAQRPHLPEVSASQRKARLAWNAGLTGKGRPANEPVAVQACAVTECGTAVIGRRPPTAGMVQVGGSQDGAAAHWYCPDRCAAIARARAELRSIPMRRGGEVR